MSRLAYLILIVVLFILLLLALLPAYHYHLIADAIIFYDRASFFINNLNFSNLKFNEYQPGALLFFVFLSPVLLISHSIETFASILLLVNSSLVFALAYIYSKYTNIKSVFIFAPILLFSGPIIFFRFDLLVVTLLSLVLLWWKEKKESLSMFFLAMATQVKVYPVIFLPYLLFLSYKSKGFAQVFKNIVTFLISLFSFTLVFILIFKLNLVDLFYSFNFHALKPLSLESPWANLIILLKFFTTYTFPKLVAFGLWGISYEDSIVPLWFLNLFWIVPFTLVNIWFFRRFSNTKPIFDIRFCLFNLLVFLIFSKVLAPQYLLWFSFLIPLIDCKTIVSKTFWRTNFLLILLISLLYQYIYPLNYTNWLNSFQTNSLTFLFLINTLRNILLLALAVRLFKNLLNDSKNSTFG